MENINKTKGIKKKSSFTTVTIMRTLHEKIVKVKENEEYINSNTQALEFLVSFYNRNKARQNKDKKIMKT